MLVASALWAVLGCAAPRSSLSTPASPTTSTVPPMTSSPASPSPASPPPTLAGVLAASQPEDWRTPDPENVLYLELASGRVVFEMAPAFAPHHVENVRALVRERYFDGLAIVRVQENYVVQWADPENQRPIRHARRTLEAEFDRPAAGLAFQRLADPDTYAPEVGFVDGFPAARESPNGRAWLVHCYGMLGAGRDDAADSGGGAELYVVIGQAPRQLDRNVTLFGRVLLGMEHLTTLPRGTEALGFYATAAERVPITKLQLAADVPAPERTELEVLRTDTSTFAALVESRRNRREAWFQRAAGRIDVCNVPLVVRLKPTAPRE